jgi:hypothetical protein
MEHPDIPIKGWTWFSDDSRFFSKDVMDAPA